MVSDELLISVCSSRNIRTSTIKSYRSAVRKYESFNGMSMSQLIDEAIGEEENAIPIKKRKIRRRLLDFRAYLLDSTLAIGTVGLTSQGSGQSIGILKLRFHIFPSSNQRRITSVHMMTCPKGKT